MMAIIDTVWSIAVIVLAFSVLSFVHELGHFLAALAVGVRPERFFIGFDIFGLGLKKEYKGCVYGIGLLPLGGYVKLAGQSDDPREQKDNSTGASDEYSSKPLWAQATIIVAGVVMNMIFGYLVLVYLYSAGMPQIPPYIGSVTPNTPAAMAGFKPGDRIISINNTPVTSYSAIRKYVIINPGVEFNLELERDGKKFVRKLKGYQGEMGLNQVGLKPAAITKISFPAKSPLTDKYYKDILEQGDEIIQLNGVKLPLAPGGGSIAEEIIAQNPCRSLKAVVKRGADEFSVEIPVLGEGAYDIGYGVGVKIDSVTDNSAAQEAGIDSGDVVSAVIVDGVRYSLLSRDDLSTKIRAQTYKPVALKINRSGDMKTVLITPKYMGSNPELQEGHDTLLGITVTDAKGLVTVDKIIEGGPSVGILNSGDVIDSVNGKSVTDLGADVAEACTGKISFIIAGKKDPVEMKPRINLYNGVAMVGISMGIYPEIVEVRPNSIAAKYFSPGDRIGSVILVPGAAETVISWLGKGDVAKEPVRFATPKNIVNSVMASSNQVGEISGVTGFAFNPAIGKKKAIGLLPAAGYAFDKTLEMSGTVYKILHRLLTKQIDARNMSGPLGIINQMHDTATGEDAFIHTMMLLALISINLAIFNLLPFPVLDGGHLLFIVIEWVKGSPPSNRIREISQYFGVFCLLALMLFATYNDIVRIADNWVQKSLVEKTVQSEPEKE